MGLSWVCASKGLNLLKDRVRQQLDMSLTHYYT